MSAPDMSVLIHAMDPYDFSRPIPFDPMNPGFCCDTARMLLLCSRLIYEDPATIAGVLSSPAWGLDPKRDFRFISNAHTQLFLMRREALFFLIFRGTETENFWDWRVDADVRLHVDPILGREGGLVHHGFSESLGAVWDPLCRVLEEWSAFGDPPRVIVSGHSLGAALAELAAVRLASRENAARVLSLYSFGKPRVGNTEFAACAASLLGQRSFAVVNRDDIVPRLPPGKWGYKPSGTLCHLGLGRGPMIGGDWRSEVPDSLADPLQIVTKLFRTKRMASFVKVAERHGPAGVWDRFGKALAAFPPGYLDSLKTLIPSPLLDHFPGEYLKRLVVDR